MMRTLFLAALLCLACAATATAADKPAPAPTAAPASAPLEIGAWHDDSYDQLRATLPGIRRLAAAEPAKKILDDGFDDGFDDMAKVDNGPSVADPFESWNRFWFQFNDALYFKLTEPLAKGYNIVVPEMVRVGIRNFFHNLMFPVRFLNNLLQGKFQGAGVEAQQFILNTVVGVGGLVDQAQYHKTKVEVSDEDLGQTLGSYGVGHGVYLVWPVLGPSSLRDTVGMLGDSFADPLSYVTPFGSEFVQENPEIWETLPLKGYKTFNSLSLHLGEYEAMKKAALDPYTSMRDAYIQYRAKQVAK